MRLHCESITSAREANLGNPGLAVVHGEPRQSEWVCTLRLSATDSASGRVKVDVRQGREAETRFRVVQTRVDPVSGEFALVEARPLTGRTHQIRVHLTESGHPVVGDGLYGRGGKAAPPLRRLRKFPLGLRAVCLSYVDPFQKRRVRIEAPTVEFVKAFGFDVEIPCPDRVEQLAGFNLLLRRGGATWSCQ